MLTLRIVSAATLYSSVPSSVRSALRASAGADGVVPAMLARAAAALVQHRAEMQERSRRALLRQGDRMADETFAFAGGTE